VLKKIFIFSFILFGQTLANWDIPILPLSEVKPGMKGIGKTIFYGDQIEEFGVTVLEIMEDLYPQRDIIIVRLTGEKAEKTGVMHGMSGSPIYIKNKLVGALALRIGDFQKEPIAGIMPIEQMLQIPEKEKTRSDKSPTKVSLLPQFLETSLVGAKENFWQNIISRNPTIENSSTVLQPIQTPLNFSGFSNALVSEYKNVFNSIGFTPIAGGKARSTGTDSKPFEPGSAVAQVLISGDYSIDATGTVTAVSGNQLLAFGHYAFNLGSVNMPLAKTKVIASLPSYMASSKMAASTEIVGTIRQDRMSGILGDLSIQPEMVPVVVSHNSPITGKSNFNFKMAADETLSNLLPFYLRIAIIQAITSARLAGEQNSIHLDAKINLADGRTVSLYDFFSSKKVFGFFGTGMDAANVGDLVASALGVLMVNNFKSPKVKNIQINTTEVLGQNYATIRSVWQDKTVISPGDSLHLAIKLRSSKGESIDLARNIKIPSNVTAKNLTIIISSAPTLTAYEMRLTPDKFRPVNYEHLLEILKNRRKNNNLYIQVRMRDGGLIVEGKELSALPPSIMGIMDSRRSSGVTKRLVDRVLFEHVIPTEFHIAGAKRLSVQIHPPTKARMPENRTKRKVGERVHW
jgi:hypothetical protein